MTGVTGDKHWCSVAVSDVQRKNGAVRLLVVGLRGCYITGDNSRWCRRCLDRVVRDKRRPALCMKGEQKGSVKAGGFGFVSFGKVRKR
ncbi:hypothetical protein Hanom_Chr10g00880631 [Helianthus anomalus]